MSTADAAKILNVWGCSQGAHRCGGMPNLTHRCETYAATFIRVSKEKTVSFPQWWETFQSSTNCMKPSFKRPSNCIHQDRLIVADQENFPYLAVSYVWAINPQRQIWEGRPVTIQALDIAKRLNKHTSLPLWIDAICIHQGDNKIKMVELAKMADIYRGAAAVICLIPEMCRGTSNDISWGISMMETDAYKSLEATGDSFGCYMFSTLGASSRLQDLYNSRWWTRVWTFQEAVLNAHTYLINQENETIPIMEALKIASSIRRYAMTMPAEQTLGQSMGFWDSTATMTEATSRALPLGDAVACIWRRNATVKHDMVYALLGVCRLEQIKPDYDMPFNNVLQNLFQHAVDANDDYTWIAWCHTIPLDTEEGMCLVPTPDRVHSHPFTSISKVESKIISSHAIVPEHRRGGGNRGVLIPYQSTGVVRWQSSPQNLSDTILTLRDRGLSSSEIWDMLFGMQIGLVEDIEVTLGASCPSEALLNAALKFKDGELKLSSQHRDMQGTFPFSGGIGFMNYLGMTDRCWNGTWLVIAESQGGTTVMPAHMTDWNKGVKKARLYSLPVNLKQWRSIVILVPDDTPFRVFGIGIMIEKKGTGKGKWLSRRFG